MKSLLWYEMGFLVDDQLPDKILSRISIPLSQLNQDNNTTLGITDEIYETPSSSPLDILGEKAPGPPTWHYNSLEELPGTETSPSYQNMEFTNEMSYIHLSHLGEVTISEFPPKNELMHSTIPVDPRAHEQQIWNLKISSLQQVFSTTQRNAQTMTSNNHFKSIIFS